MNRHIPDGEVSNYDRLQNYLKSITYELPQRDEITQADALFRLAIEGGGYCGPRKFEVCESLYSELATGSARIPSDLKVLLRLQDARTLWFQSKYAEALVLNNENQSCCVKLLRWFFDFQDLHFYNVFLNLLGQALGLRKSSADNDHVAIVDPLTKSALRSYTQQFEEAFNQTYTAEFAIDALQEGVGSSSLPRHNLFDWWASWIDRQSISPEQKTELTEELQDGTLLGHPMQTGDLLAPGPFNVQFLKAMSLDIGILKSGADTNASRSLV
jgi:hypothetical protein